MATETGPTSGWPVEGRSDWDATFELLKARQYEQAAEHLHTVLVTTDHLGDGLLVDILAAAHRICLACGQCRAEEAWHRQAHEEANRRERELRQQLYAILNSVGGRPLPQPGAKRAEPPLASKSQLVPLTQEPPESGNRHGLLQRIQDFLSWWANSWSVNQETPTVLLANEADLPAASSDDDVKMVSAISTRPSESRSTLIDSDEQQVQQPAPCTSLVVYCLGSFRVYQKNQLIENWPSRKGQAVFKYLVAHRHSPVSKDILMDTFWPDAEPEAARRNLHQAIYALRQTLRRGGLDFQHILFENDCYRFNPNLDIWLDDEEFEQHFLVGQQFEQGNVFDNAVAEYGIAEGLYRGDFMAEDLYEEWPGSRRQYLWQTYLSVAHRLAHYYLARREYAATITLSQRILTMDNCQEEAHQNLMKCYLAQGQRHLAIRQYQLCLQALEAELNLPPSEEMQVLYNQITNG